MSTPCTVNQVLNRSRYQRNFCSRHQEYFTPKTHVHTRRINGKPFNTNLRLKTLPTGLHHLFNRSGSFNSTDHLVLVILATIWNLIQFNMILLLPAIKMIALVTSALSSYIRQTLNPSLHPLFVHRSWQGGLIFPKKINLNTTFRRVCWIYITITHRQ